MKALLVSVIMPCYKMGSYIGDALASVGAQAHKNWEILAVDDCGPEDGTKGAIETFAAKHPDHRIEYIRHKTNQGVSTARNTALAHSKGSIVAFLDPDDYWLSSYLFESIQILHKDDSISVCATPAHIFHSSPLAPTDKVEFYSSWEREIFPYSLGIRNGFAISGMVVRKSPEVVFDESNSLQHVEDWDLWLRLAEAGAVFHFHNKVACLYRKHESGATARGYMILERMQALYRKHRSFLGELSWVGHAFLDYRVQQQLEILDERQQNPMDVFSRVVRRLKQFLAKPAPKPQFKV